MAKTYTQADLDLVNEALRLLREDTPMTLDELQNSTEPIPSKVRTAFEPARLDVLLAQPWSFATRRIRVMATPEHGGWTFVRPADALRLVAVEDMAGDRGIGWRTYADKVLCDRPPTDAVILYDEDDLTVWPPLVLRALAHCLARDLAMSVTGRDEDRRAEAELLASSLRQAATVAANEGNPGRTAWGRSRFVGAMRGGSYPSRKRTPAPMGGWL